MDNHEIRLRILSFLYEKYFNGEAMKYFNTAQIVAGAELDNENSTAIAGNMLYLGQKNFVEEMSTMGSAYPESMYINASGVDFVEQVFDKSIQKMQSSQETIKGQVTEIEQEQNHTNRIKKYFSLIFGRPELIRGYVNLIMEEVGRYLPQHTIN